MAEPAKNYEKLFGSIYSDVPPEAQSANPEATTPYAIKPENWYRTIPYALRIVSFPSLTDGSETENDTSMFYFFPVNPESVTINTPFATVVTPTVGGVVQEHSGAVFYNITLSGTTGVIPEINILKGVPRSADKELRPLAAQDGLIPEGALGGFGSGAIAAVNSIVGAIMGSSSKMASAKQQRKSGYTAYHVLYKFIWLYHFAKANGAPQQLRFMNYKDNNQYNCVVTSFNLSRDKSRPHLYQYSIQLKGWKLATVGQEAPASDPAKRLAALGLDENPSVKALAFRVINDTKAVLNGAAGLLNAAAQDLAF